MHSLEHRCEEFIRRHSLVAPGQLFLLAVSGGIDSMVMLHLFSRLVSQFQIRIGIVHVNHQLRGDESTGDEQFVRAISDQYQIPLYCERVDVLGYMQQNNMSKQAAARILRYECFRRFCHTAGAHGTATAHHADDNAETVLLHIERGTGIHGLAGIPVRHSDGSVIRPLLFARRTEIEWYAREKMVPFRNDSSNALRVYRRNYLRQSILPVLENRHPGVIEILNSVAETMHEISTKLDDLVEQKYNLIVTRKKPNVCILHTEAFLKEPVFLQDEILVAFLRCLGIEPTEMKVSALRALCMKPTGRSIELSGSYSAWKNRGNVVIQEAKTPPEHPQQVECGRSYQYRGSRISLGLPEPRPETYSSTRVMEYIDADLLGRTMVLRSWHTGDWFIPLGMKKKKKLSDFFTDQKIPRFQKTSIPVLESDGAIVWICGRRIDNRFKLTEQTKTVIRLIYQP